MTNPEKKSPRRPLRSRLTRAARLALPLLALWAGATPCLAAPQGEQVTSGEVQFDRDGSLTVIHASDGSIIQYDSFDILAGETVRFIQPDEAARVLNRVLSVDPTLIDGSLLANGIVYIVNPAGVFFGGEAVVDVGGLVAAAGRLSDRDFLEGRDHFSDLAGAVENRGEIRGGAVALLGRSVANHGSIVAGDGLVAMVAGQDVVLTRLGGHVVVHVDGPDGTTAPEPVGIEQAGRIEAGAGEVVLTTGDLYSLAINHTGITRGRDIRLDGGAGLVSVRGELDASAAHARSRGGTLHVLGDRIAVSDATLDASGPRGGGEIRIGGDLGGEGELRAASRTWVGEDVTLRADATGRGDGGSVVVWADEATGFFGEISARGGPAGGDGGFAEVSGRQALVSRGEVDLRAPAGETGTVLYDPQDIEIRGGTADGSDDPDPNDDQLFGDGGTPGEILFGDLGDGSLPFVIFESEIEGANANLVLEAENSITVAGSFDHDADGAGGEDPGLDVVRVGGGNSLTLRTRNDPGDETGSAEAPGIDLTDGGALDALTFRTLGGAVAVTTGDGSIRVGSIDTSPTAAEAAAGAITLAAGGSGDVAVAGTLTAVGADGPGADELGGRGGNVVVTTEEGDIALGPVVADGGDGDARGGRGGNVSVEALGVGAVTLLGDLRAVGGDAAGASGIGGDGGNVLVRTFQGAVTSAGADTSGGDGASRGGDSGSLSLIARGDAEEGEPAGTLVFGAPLVSVAGSGAVDGSGGDITLRATEALDHDGFAGPHVVSSGDVSLGGRSVGAAGTLQIDGGGDVEGRRLIVQGEGRIDVDVVQAGFEDLVVLQLDAEGDVDLVQAGGDVIDIDGAPGTSTVRTVDTHGNGASAVYALQEEDAALVIESGAADVAGIAVFDSRGDILLESGADPAVTVGEEALQLRANTGGEGAGEIRTDGGAGPHIAALGDVTLRGDAVGATGTLEIDAGGTADSLLAIDVAGRADVAVVQAGFDALTLRQRDASADVDVVQAGGDVVEIDGAPGAGPEDGATSSVMQVDTTGNGVAFGLSLRETDPEAPDPNLVIPTGSVSLGGSGVFSADGDLTLGDVAGTAISMPADRVLSLEADADGAGDGAIRDGVPGPDAAQVETAGSSLLLFGGQGVGEADDPIQLSGGGAVAAEARADGGIHLRNVDAGELRLTQVFAAALGGTFSSLPGVIVRAGPGDISVENDAGGITIDRAVRTFDPAGDFRARAMDGAAITFDWVPDVPPAQQTLTSVITGGSQRYESPVVLGRPDTRLEAGGDLHFDGAVDSADPDTDPDLAGTPAALTLTTAGTTRFGDGDGEDRVGGGEPLQSLVVLAPPDDGDPETPPPTPSVEVHAASVATVDAQVYTPSVALGGATTFEAGGAVAFGGELRGLDPSSGSAVVNSGASVLFGADVSLGPDGAGRFEVNLTGEEPGVVEFVTTGRVEAGSGGIHLNPGGRDEVPDTATIFKRAPTEPDTGFPEGAPPEGTGPVVFETSGDFVLGRREKLSIGDALTIRADSVTAGDIAALELNVDTQIYTVLGREPGTVRLAAGGEVQDAGTDIVANRITLAATPVWDGEGALPTFFTQTGGLKAPGSMEAFSLRQIDPEGEAITLDDFFEPFGAALDLTGTGPGAVGNPASQNVEEGSRVAYLLRPRFGDEEPALASKLDTAQVERFLDCADLGQGPPPGCPGAPPVTDRVLQTPRARELAALWRALRGPESDVVRAAFREAVRRRGPEGGLALRRALETPPRDEAALAYLNRVDALLFELRMLNLAPEVAERLERELLGGLARQVGAPQLDAATLREAALASRAGLVL